MPAVFINNPNATGVVATIFVRTGSASEKAGQQGISHLVEHLLFSQGRSHEKLFPLNLELEARSRKDFCYYEISHHRSYLKEMLELLFGTVFFGDVSEKELENQKGVIANEINEKNDEPFVRLDEELEKELYLESEWRHSVLGDEASLVQIKLKDVQNWLKQKYTPNNLLLSITGNFDLTKTIGDVESLLKTSKTKSPAKRTSLTPPKYKKASGTKILEKGFSQAYLGIAFRAEGKMGEQKYFDNIVLADVLGKALEIELQNNPDFYDVEFFYHQYLTCGEFRVETSTKKQKAERTLNFLVGKIEKLEVTKKFFQKIKKFTAKQFELRQDSLAELASLPMYLLAGRNGISSPQQEARKLQNCDYEYFLKKQKRIYKNQTAYKVILK